MSSLFSDSEIMRNGGVFAEMETLEMNCIFVAELKQVLWPELGKEMVD